MYIFLGQKKYGIWGDFSEKFQVLCKNPDEVTRFYGTATYNKKERKYVVLYVNKSGSLKTFTRGILSKNYSFV